MPTIPSPIEELENVEAVYRVASTSTDQTYTVVAISEELPDGETVAVGPQEVAWAVIPGIDSDVPARHGRRYYICTCLGWNYRRECKHVRMIIDKDL